MKNRMVWVVLLSALLLAGAAFAQQPGNPGGGNSGTPGIVSGVPSPVPSIVAPVASADIPIGPDGAAYLLRPQMIISLGFLRTVEYKTELVAVSLDKNQPTKWKVTLTGLIQRAVAGDSYLYAQLAPPASSPIPIPIPIVGVTGGNSSTSASDETQLIFVSYTDGSQAKTVKVTGTVQNMQVRKVNTTEYIYLTVVRQATAGQAASVGLVILNSTGSQVNTLDAETDAPVEM
jgi:hypothetical protein